MEEETGRKQAMEEEESRNQAMEEEVGGSCDHQRGWAIKS
jgi:hypothetical protein